MLRRVTATRYVVPLREGGSLPAVVEADDGRLWVVKFRGAGQGVKALVAEVIGAALARAAALRTPETCVVEINAMFGKTEPDAEIQALLLASPGANLGCAFLSGALGFDPATRPAIDPLLASRIVAFDALIQNIDRTPRNPNLLWWQHELWLIDHGAALYWHHAADPVAAANPTAPFTRGTEHVLLPWATALDDAARELALALDDATLAAALADVPDAWIAERSRYLDYLTRRRAALPGLLEELTRGR